MKWWFWKRPIPVPAYFTNTVQKTYYVRCTGRRLLSLDGDELQYVVTPKEAPKGRLVFVYAKNLEEAIELAKEAVAEGEFTQ